MTEDSLAARRPTGDRQFHTTEWSVVLAAGAAEPASHDALSRLCEAYWYPLYACVRRRTGDAHQAQDLTQAFFAHLLENHGIERADPRRGRFRAFLLAALDNFLANEWNKARAAKRGGGRPAISLDFDTGESRYQIEPADTLTPEMLFERRWILTLLDRVLDALRVELAEAGKAEHFEQLKDGLTGETTAEQYERAAETLGITAAAARQAAYRMRKRYRQLFRAEVASTVANEAEVDEEIGRLLKILAE